MYTSGQLAKECNISLRTVQYYDRCGLLHASRTRNDQRQYTDEDMKRLRQILAYKSLGFSLKDIKKIITSNGNNSILRSLIAHQQTTIKQEIRTLNNQQAGLSYLAQQLAKHNNFPGNIEQGVFNIMKRAQKLKQLRIKMVITGFFMTICIWSSLLYVVLNDGNPWWLFVGAFTTILLGYYITSIYFHHSCYLCPHCQNEFTPAFKQWLFAKHTPNTRYLLCPNCKERNYCLEEYK